MQDKTNIQASAVKPENGINANATTDDTAPGAAQVVADYTDSSLRAMTPNAYESAEMLKNLALRIPKTNLTPEILSSCRDAVKTVLCEIDGITTQANMSTIERYYTMGCVVNALGTKLKEDPRFDQWMKDTMIRPTHIEVLRQSRKIASMGEPVLKFKHLGKNKVLELCYFLKEMEEYTCSMANPASISRRLLEIEQINPFPRHDDQVEIDTAQFLKHMNALINKFRFERAFKIQDVCSFEDARLLTVNTKFAVEPKQAEELAEKLKGESDKKAALKNLIDGGMKIVKSTPTPSPKRFAETLAKLKANVDAIIADTSSVAELRQNSVFMASVDDAYNTINELRTVMSEDGVKKAVVE